MSANVPTPPLWWRHERHGLSEWWLAGGELKRTRFVLPNGLPPRPNVFLLGARFEDVDLSGLELHSFSVADSQLDRCTFDRTSLGNVSFGVLQYHREWSTPIDWSKPLGVDAPRYNQTLYLSCHFGKIKLPIWNIHFGNARFEGCVFDDTLRSTVVRPILTQPAEFVSCRFLGRVSCVVFDGQLLRGALATRVGRQQCVVKDNDFTQAVLKSVDFRNVDLGAQRMPPGFGATG